MLSEEESLRKDGLSLFILYHSPVHFELDGDLSTDSFMMDLRRYSDEEATLRQYVQITEPVPLDRIESQQKL